MRRRVTIAVLAAGALLAAGCGGEDDEPAQARPAARSAVTVQIASFKYLPARIDVAVGGKVTWVNQDKAPHTAENKTLEGPAEFETGRLDLGDRKTVTFTQPGAYKYYCVFHRFMEADIVVK